MFIFTSIYSCFTVIVYPMPFFQNYHCTIILYIDNMPTVLCFSTQYIVINNYLLILCKYIPYHGQPLKYIYEYTYTCI